MRSTCTPRCFFRNATRRLSLRNFSIFLEGCMTRKGKGMCACNSEVQSDGCGGSVNVPTFHNSSFHCEKPTYRRRSFVFFRRKKRSSMSFLQKRTSQPKKGLNVFTAQKCDLPVSFASLESSLFSGMSLACFFCNQLSLDSFLRH